MPWLITLTLFLSLALSLMFVPLVRVFAHKVGMEDRPDSDRKLHRKPIALGGGIAVFAATAMTFLGMVFFDQISGASYLEYVTSRWYFLFLAAGAMLAVGLVDDIWALRGRQKLLLQCVIIGTIVYNGFVVHDITLFGIQFAFTNLHFGNPGSELADNFHLGYPLTFMWLLLCVNALNLIDGADGMATTTGCIISAGLAVLSLQAGSDLAAIAGFALAGALLGFLFFNKPPATIFLGDAGSMMIGLIIGVVAVWSNAKDSTVAVAASAPLAVLAIPFFDSFAAIVRRWLTGRSIYATDRGHLHHLLQEKFGSTGMLVVVAILCIFTSALAVLATAFAENFGYLDIVGVVIAVGILVASRSFGHAECRLIVGKGSNFARSFFTRAGNCETSKLQTRVPLQGTGDWDSIWEQLVEFAKTHELAKVRIDLNLSWLHEGYHASWKSVRLPEKAFQLVIRLPLFTTRSDGEQVSIGLLEIVAPANDSTVYKQVAELSERLVSLSPEIDSVVAELEAEHKAKKASKAKVIAPVVDQMEPEFADADSHPPEVISTNS